MKGKIRFTYLAFFLIFIFSLCTVNVFADDENDPIATDPPPTMVTEPAPTEVTQAPATQATTKKITQPTTSATKATKATKATQQVKQTYATSSTKANNNGGYSTQATQATRSTYVASTRAETSPVYDVEDEKVATDTLKKKDWSSIVERLNNSDNNNSDDDVDSFDFIQNSTSDDDNTIFILYGGIALEVLASIIFITLIILAVRRKKALNKHYTADGVRNVPANNSRTSSQRAANYPPHRASIRSQQRQVKKRSKYDTDEVYVPRNARQSNGRRYKPKH